MINLKRPTDAFTILELLVGIGILGILTAVAIPSFQSKISRSRQQQAKTFLAALHATEDVFFTETGTYTMCLKQIGLDLTNEKKLWYSTGMNAGGAASDCGPNGDSTDCLAYKFSYAGGIAQTCGDGDDACNCAAANGQTYFNSNTCVDTGFAGCVVPISSAFPRAVKTAFTAQARGNVSTKAAYDSWSIDHNKTLVNFEPGI